MKVVSSLVTTVAGSVTKPVMHAPLSRKLVAAGLTNLLAFGIAFLVFKLGLHLSPIVATEVSGIVAWAAGLGAGWLAKEFPALIGTPPK